MYICQRRRSSFIYVDRSRLIDFLIAALYLSHSRAARLTYHPRGGKIGSNETIINCASEITRVWPLLSIYHPH